jgi:competence protein ComEC
MLSVSGLHVASLAVIVIGLARLVGAARWVGFLLAAISAVLMIPFVGPSPPIIRAAVMIVIVLAGRWVGRGRDQWQVLALAAVVLMALNPFAVYDVGFQLSFSAVGGILALAAPLQRLLKRLPEGIASNVSVSLAASIGTAPVALAVFGRTSLVAPLANLLVVPALPLITGFGMASAILGFAWTGLSVGLDTLASIPLTWVVSVSRVMAPAPVLGSQDVGRMLAALVGSAVVLPAALALAGRAVRAPFSLPLPFFRSSVLWLRNHRPRSRRLGRVLAVGVVIAGVMLGLVAYPVGTRGLQELRVLVGSQTWPEQVEVRVLDVGQGNAVLVRTPGRRALLFDGGPEDCGLSRQLHDLGVSKLDLVVISHPHADHFAGLLESLDGLEVAAVVDHVQVRTGPQPNRTSDGQAYSRLANHATEGREALEYLELRDRLAELGCRYSHVGTGCSAYVDEVTVQFFAPESPLVLLQGRDPWAARGTAPTGEEMNVASLVAVVQTEHLAVLIPGDAEVKALSRYDLPRADLLVVPHHGSQGAVSERLMDAVGTRVGIISVGEANPFGHPFPGTVSLLEEAAGTVVRTDTAGWVSCRLNEDRILITTERIPDQ